MDFSNVDQSIPRDLPLLKDWIGKRVVNKPFKGATVFLIQHQLDDSYALVKALLDLGLERDQLIWIDIPYSARSEVREAMIKDLGIPEKCFRIHDFPLLELYSPYQLKRVQEVLVRLLMKPRCHLIVLDDGAYFLEAASCFAKRLPAIAVVEQTARGIIKMKESAALRSYSSLIPHQRELIRFTYR